ncbi:MAG: hypothetical protein ACREE2_18665, partial [Stellaceae bacterium]
ALASARNASDAFNLRCEVREKLIGFLQAEFPGALPRQRAEIAGRLPAAAEGSPADDPVALPHRRADAASP